MRVVKSKRVAACKEGLARIRNFGEQLALRFFVIQSFSYGLTMCMIMQFSSIVLSPHLAKYFDVWAWPTCCAGIVRHGRGIYDGEMDSDSQQHLDLVFLRRGDDSDETRRGDDAATSSRGVESGMRLGTSCL